MKDKLTKGEKRHLLMKKDMEARHIKHTFTKGIRSPCELSLKEPLNRFSKT